MSAKNSSRSCVLVGALVAFAWVSSASAGTDEELARLRPFLSAHCHECHGPEKQKNGLRFDTLGTELSEVETLETWQEILDQLNLGKMPPRKSPQPSGAEVTAVIGVLTPALERAYAERESTGGEAVIRRLNRFELRNTIRDLLLLDGPEFQVGSAGRLVDNNGNGRVENTSSDPFRHFPEDESLDGFDNVGDHLVMSDFFLQLMIDAAEESLDLATHLGERPDVGARRIESPIEAKGNYSQSAPGPLEHYQRELGQGYDAIFRRYHRFGRMRPDALRRGVGTSARYRITIEASAHHQEHPWGEVVETDPREPLVLGLHLVSHRNEHTSTPLESWELEADGERRSYTVDAWIDREWLPWLGWENGPDNKSVWADPILKRYLPEARVEPPDRKDKEQYEAWLRSQAMAVLRSGYEGPHIRVFSLTLEPLIDQWPPPSHTQLHGDGPVAEADIESLVRSFAERAFRRPVTAEEVAPYVALVRRHMPTGVERGASVVIAGLRYKVYDWEGTRLPDFSTLNPVSEGALADGLLDLGVAGRDAHYGIVFEGKLTAPRDGDYDFEMASDDGTRVIVAGNEVIDHDGIHGASTRKGRIRLKAGEHAFRVEYFAFGVPNSMRASWTGPGLPRTPLTGAPTPEGFAAANPLAAQTMQALRAGYTAILCAPEFLYLHERAGPLDSFAIASRLSYFLWSSMPDERLMHRARAGELTDPDALSEEVDRMLDDAKAEAFARHFVEGWLRLDEIKDSPPERNGPFRVYHDRRLERHILAQTSAFFADLVRSNGEIRQLIASEHTFLNEPVAAIFYRRDDVRGEFMRRVPTNDPRRGGIFTQPSVMTATANGVDTTPIVRGVWVLENILGTPPSAPPPDVEPLPPDLRSARTIREQLELHREQESCSSCHREIDPLGFAFENFNPIGQWRERYRSINKEIDPSSAMADGRAFADIIEFKEVLVEREELLVRCLTEKLLVYASGRALEPADRGEVDQIVRALDAGGPRLRDLITLIVRSEVFLTK